MINLVEIKPGTLMRDGRYKVLREIQRGGTAIVVLALDEQSSQQVALKCMQVSSGDKACDSSAVPIRVIQHEIAFSTSVSSPSFVKLFDVFSHGSMLVIAMEYVEGPDLLDLLNQKDGALSEPEAIFYLHQMASAALTMHQHGFAHRDLKPENSVLTPSGQVKLIDFGLAKHLESAHTLGVGTPDYMAPEMLGVGKASKVSTGSSYDARLVDAWALGVCLYLLTTGRYPYEDPKHPNPAQSVLNILRGQVQPFPPTMSQGTRSLISGLLKTDPMCRTTLKNLVLSPFLVAKALEYARSIGREDLILNQTSAATSSLPSINVSDLLAGASQTPTVNTPPPPTPQAPQGFMSRLFGLGGRGEKI